MALNLYPALIHLSSVLMVLPGSFQWHYSTHNKWPRYSMAALSTEPALARENFHHLCDQLNNSPSHASTIVHLCTLLPLCYLSDSVATSARNGQYLQHSPAFSPLLPASLPLEGQGLGPLPRISTLGSSRYTLTLSLHCSKCPGSRHFASPCSAMH